MFIIGNGRLVTRNKNGDFYENGAAITDGSVIKDVGDFDVMRKKYAHADFIDARGGVIMPALINTHHHIYSAFARGLSIKGYAPTGFDDILEGLWWRLDRKLTLEDVYYSALTTYIDCIKNGVTTVFDHHASYGAINGSLAKISQAARELGLRTSLCYEVSDRDGTDCMEDAIRENSEYMEAVKRDPMQKGMMGLHASFTLSAKTLDLAVKHTPSWAGFHVHVAEGLSDVQKTLKMCGKRVVERFFDAGILGAKTLAVHCVHITPREAELLRRTDTMVVHNPESNMGNAVGCPAVIDLVKRGVLTGLGTDGYTSDMLESYKVANILHKHNLCDPTAAWGEIPDMLFKNNAVIAERIFDTKLGVIEAGASADIAVFDYDPLTPMTKDNINSHILFGFSGRQATNTISAGVPLMRDSQILGVDEKRIFARARELAEALGKRINA